MGVKDEVSGKKTSDLLKHALLQNRVDGVARDVYFYSFRKSAYQPAASPISFRLRSAMA